MTIPGIVLAAGGSTRMGRPKQLLRYGCGTLLQHAVDAALEAALKPLIVVVGAEADQVQQAISHTDVSVVRNIDWASGMGSSIHAGMRALGNTGENYHAVAILLGDQPKITALHLSGMRRLLELNNAVAVAAEYGGSVGVPAFFRRELFDQLASLPPGAGAKTLLNSLEGLVRFPLPEAAVDIDTPEDYSALVGEGGRDI